MATSEASVQIDAPRSIVWELLIEDRSDFSKGNDEVRWTEKLTDGAVRKDYSYKSTFIHQRHKCEMYTRVTEFEEERVLEEQFFHRCEASNRSSQGTFRYELLPDGDGTTLVLVSKRRVSGLAGFVAGLLVSNCGLRSKLEITRSRAEVRHSPLEVSA